MLVRVAAVCALVEGRTFCLFWLLLLVMFGLCVLVKGRKFYLFWLLLLCVLVEGQKFVCLCCCCVLLLCL